MRKGVKQGVRGEFRPAGASSLPNGDNYEFNTALTAINPPGFPICLESWRIYPPYRTKPCSAAVFTRGE